MNSLTVEHIEMTPGVCGGRPRIAGHRVRVQDVVDMHDASGLTPDEIVSQLVGITLADVYAALSYFHDYRDEIREDMKSDQRVSDQIQQTQVSKLAQKLIRPHGTSDPISS